MQSAEGKPTDMQHTVLYEIGNILTLLIDSKIFLTRVEKYDSVNILLRKVLSSCPH